MSFQQITVQKNLDISIVELKDIENNRLDPEFYGQVYILDILKICHKNYKNIKETGVEIFSGPFGSFLQSGSYKQDGNPFIRISDVKDTYLDKKSMVFLDDEEFKRMYKYHLDVDDIVLSKIGTIGRASIITRDIGKVAISENNIGMKFATGTAKTYKIYLLTFLLSKYGQDQLMKYASGNVQLKLNVKDIEGIKIPIPADFFQDKINETMNNSQQQREQSKSLYQQSEQLLLSELGIENYHPTENTISIKNSDEVEIFSRMDAEFFQPKYDEVIEKISKTKTDTLEHIADYKKGVEPGSEAYTDDENGVPFIRVSDVSINGVDRIEKRISPELAESYKGAYSPRKGEVLITKDGTIGISCAITEDMNSVLSGAFLRLQPKIKIEQEYLALVLNSIVCKLQIERFSGGAIIEHLKPGDLMQIEIPILSESIQQKIAELVTQSHKARNESKKLLEVAKRAVEVFIEEDEENAMEFISKSI